MGVIIYFTAILSISTDPSIKDVRQSAKSDSINHEDKPPSLIRKIIIKLKIWVESPYFILHFVRISMIFFIYLFQNYLSFVLYI
jgi:hypothetical protein